MTNQELKQYLKQNNLVVQQWELNIISIIKKQEETFQISYNEVFDHAISEKNFHKRFREKMKAFDKSVSDLDKFTKEIQDIENMTIEELENKSNHIIASFEKSKNFWTKEDRDELNSIFDKYFKLQRKIIITTKISNFFLKYKLTKIIIQLSIFSISFILSYYLGEILEPYFSYFNHISRQFFIAVFIFITLEKLLDKFEDYLLFWRANKLFEYFRRIMPLMERMKPKL